MVSGEEGGGRGWARAQIRGDHLLQSQLVSLSLTWKKLGLQRGLGPLACVTLSAQTSYQSW